ncbi:hypothetical protein D9Q98_009747 [Chlorella vulgaris]|uniref:Protein kinase domain-containing protein n=1 Tax=Chlorella vulgaris TaxID=3077 RepID=A0A9D4TF03_CHLVU|nr:hypothetical protein D9Q98_009747 [Chlorella vulgaris]
MGPEAHPDARPKLVGVPLETNERARGTPDEVWNFGASGRPATPQTAAFGQPATRQPHPASGATPPSIRTTHSLFKGVRTSSGSLTGLLKQRPAASAAPEPRNIGSPFLSPTGAAAAPLFELRGAALLPPSEAARLASAARSPSPSLNKASQQQRQQQYHPYLHSKPPPPSPAYSIQARAGGARAPTPGSSSSGSTRGTSPRPQRPQQPQPAATVVAAHGLDLCSSPPQRYRSGTAAPAPAPSSPALSLSQQLQLKAAAAAAAQLEPSPAMAVPTPPHGQQQPQHQDQQRGNGAASSVPAPQASTLHASGSSGGSAQSDASASGAGTTVHQNPLYGGASEGCNAGQMAASAPPPPMAAQQHQQQPLLFAAAAAADNSTSTPPAPPLLAAAGPSTATPGVSPHANLQAASNLTLASDSRPVSPAVFPSAIVAPGMQPRSRPVSPLCMDSGPVNPPSAPIPVPARLAALAPIRTAVLDTVGGVPQNPYRFLPPSPCPPASPLPAPHAAAGAAAAAAAAFRLPIYNQDGQLVGYKQNSNLIPRPGYSVGSDTSSSPHTLTHSTDIFSAASPDPPAARAAPPAAVFGAGAGSCAAQAQAQPPRAASRGDKFREYAVQPCKGFADEANMVPGYVLGPVLGKGGFCSVRKALHELTGQPVACKIIEKSKLKDPKDRDRVDRECRVMRNLSNHTTVARLYEYVETQDHVYLMMEEAARGSLLDYVRERKRLPEEEAVQIFQQLLHSLQFCHRKDVVHRDIKLENILIDAAGRMKLIDFGLCGYYVAGKRLRCHCGSPSYAAPEIVARKDYLGPPVDVWSLGIVLFAMLAGYLPFHAKEKKQLSEKILAGVYKPAAWMSPAAQDLVSRMLTLDPEQRITLEQAWTHPWVASAPRWQPPGVGAGRLYRSLTDPATGAVLPDEAVLMQLEGLGADLAATRRALRFRECNSLTAAYHLLFEAQVESRRVAALAAARERKVAAAAVAAAAAEARAAAEAAGPGDWHWDFAAISAAAAAAAPSSGSANGSVNGSAGITSHASAGSSSLRGASSPVRPRTAAALTGGASPTRFGQEAAAAGYLSPRRPSSSAAVAGPASWSPFCTPAGPSTHQQEAAAADKESSVFRIKAAWLAGSDTAGPSAIAATLVATAETPKSPCLSPMATVLSPKQLQMAVSGGADLAFSPSPSQPLPLAA